MKFVITGNRGTGKSTLAKELVASLGLPYLDVDNVVADVYSNQSMQNWLTASVGTTDRKVIADKAFSEPEFMQRLINFTRPFVTTAIRTFCMQHEHCIIEHPMYYELDDQLYGDVFVIVTTCHPAVQLERVMQRDNLTAEQAQKRINTQWPSCYKEAFADHLVFTTNTDSRSIKPTFLKEKLVRSVALRIGIPAEQVDSMLDSYRLRAYHNANHLYQMLVDYDRLPEPIKASSSDATILAILFHDLVYHTNADWYDSNERSSITKMYSIMKDVPTCSAATLKRAGLMIAATKTHVVPAYCDQNEVGVFLDLDMDILSKPYEQVLEYDVGIINEFVDEDSTDEFMARRAEFLQQLLDRKIYHVMTKWEDKAKENIARLLAERY